MPRHARSAGAAAAGTVRRRLVVTWAVAIALLASAKLLAAVEPTGLLKGNLAGVAAVVFVLLPERRMLSEGRRWSDYGLSWAGLGVRERLGRWGRGALFALAVCALVFPLFLAGFWIYGRLLPSLPPGLAHALAPYAAPPVPRFRLPARFALMIPVQLLVVALPEELFYRGWMQTTWAGTAPGRGVRVLGARLGAGFLATQALFAAGHLVVLEPWRLATFFPGLLFGWTRERTRDLAAPVVVHALANLFIATLEASFYG